MGSKEIFPQVTEVSARSECASYEKKCIFHERMLYRYLARKIEGWSVRDFLDEQGIENYVLYAVTDFTNLFLADLDQRDKKSKSGIICDRNMEAFPFGFKGRKVISPDELASRYESGEIEKIIVMSILHENEIFEELLKKGILLNDIISFVSMVWA